MLKEFREFIARGNVIDLAVGVIIGAAFGAIIASLVNDIVMPIVGILLGKVSFVDYFISLNGQAYLSLKAARDAGAPVLAYGNFLTVVLNFVIVAFIIFLVVRAVNKLKRQPPPPPAAPAAPTNEEVLLTEIRDLLKGQQVQR